MTRGVRVTAAACSAAVVLVALAGCTSDGGSTPSSSAPPTTSPVPSSPTPAPTDSPTTSVPPTTSAPPATTSAPPGSPTPTTPALPLCATLDVAVTRVPGAAGVTYGLVSVTSRGTARCQLAGIPSLRLLDASRSPMTAVATAISMPGGTATTLDPGGVASTLLEDRSGDCQADTRSSYVEVKATTAAPTVVAELSLPPCALSVKPFVPGAQPSP